MGLALGSNSKMADQCEIACFHSGISSSRDVSGITRSLGSVSLVSAPPATIPLGLNGRPAFQNCHFTERGGFLGKCDHEIVANPVGPQLLGMGLFVIAASKEMTSHRSL